MAPPVAGWAIGGGEGPPRIPLAPNSGSGAISACPRRLLPGVVFAAHCSPTTHRAAAPASAGRVKPAADRADSSAWGTRAAAAVAEGVPPPCNLLCLARQGAQCAGGGAVFPPPRRARSPACPRPHRRRAPPAPCRTRRPGHRMRTRWPPTSWLVARRCSSASPRTLQVGVAGLGPGHRPWCDKAAPARVPRAAVAAPLACRACRAVPGAAA